MEAFNPPATAQECHDAIDACLDRAMSNFQVVPGGFGTWIDRAKRLREYGAATWPDEFPPLDENGDPIKDASTQDPT